MKSEMRLPVIVLVMALISFLCIAFSSAYSFVYTLGIAGNASITTSTFTSTVGYTAASLTLEPMTDTEGLAQTTGGAVSISKNNTYNVYYDIWVSLDSTLTKTTAVPPEYIKMALYKNGTQMTDPVRMADLPVLATATGLDIDDKYKLSFDTITTGSGSNSYTLKVWLSDDMPYDYANRSVKIILGLNQKPKINVQYYNLTINYDQASGSVSLQNGTIKQNFSGSTISLANIPGGVHNIEIDGFVTTIYLCNNQSNYSNGFNDESHRLGNYALPSAACGNHTTPYKIKRYNNFTGDTLTQLGTANTQIQYIAACHRANSLDPIDVPAFSLSSSDISTLHKE